jgi:Lysozyme inhibitor LprI
MRALALICVFALQAACATAEPASARAPASDFGRLNVCLAENALPDGDPRACIGTITRVCSEESGEAAASSTGGMVNCAWRERSAWQGIFEDSASALRVRESPSQRAALDRALAAGAQWSDARCAYDASFYEGGSLARLLAAQCTRDTMAQRTIDLYQRLRDYNQ